MSKKKSDKLDKGHLAQTFFEEMLAGSDNDLAEKQSLAEIIGAGYPLSVAEAFINPVDPQLAIILKTNSPKRQ